VTLKTALSWARDSLEKIRLTAKTNKVDLTGFTPVGDRFRSLSNRADNWQNAVNQIRGAMIAVRRQATLPDGTSFSAVKGGCTTKMLQIATAVWDVIDGLAMDDYTPKGAAQLLDIARRAAATTISGATELLFTEVEAAVNRIYAALRELLSGAINIALDTIL